MYVSCLNHSTYIIYYPQSHIYLLFLLDPLPTILPNFLLFSTYCTQLPLWPILVHTPLLPFTLFRSCLHIFYDVCCSTQSRATCIMLGKPLHLSGLKRTVHVFHSVSHVSVSFSLQYLTRLLFIVSPPIPAAPLKFQLVYSHQYTVSTI